MGYPGKGRAQGGVSGVLVELARGVGQKPEEGMGFPGGWALGRSSGAFQARNRV